MGEVIAIGCPNGYQSGNPEWEAMWSSMDVEARGNFLRTASARGLVSAGYVEVTYSNAPTLNYVPGSPCYEAIQRAKRGTASEQRPEATPEGRYEIEPERGSDSYITLPGMGSHSLKAIAPYLLLLLIAAGVLLVASHKARTA